MPSVKLARRPGLPVKVRMGMRTRSEVSGSNAGDGREVGGGVRGRKPLDRDTVNGGREASSSPDGMVASTGSVEAGYSGAMVGSRGNRGYPLGHAN